MGLRALETWEAEPNADHLDFSLEGFRVDARVSQASTSTFFSVPLTLFTEERTREKLARFAWNSADGEELLFAFASTQSGTLTSREFYFW